MTIAVFGTKIVTIRVEVIAAAVDTDLDPDLGLPVGGMGIVAIEIADVVVITIATVKKIEGNRTDDSKRNQLLQINKD